MSTKTKASSKNKKATPKKPVKKIAPKNRDKKAVAKKKAVKVSKPVAPKKAVKKVVKKAVAKAPAKKVIKSPKKAVAKVAVKKASKPSIVAKSAKKAVKTAAPKARPVAAKKVVKPLKKAVAKKAAVKKIVAKASVKKVAKPVNVQKAKPAPAKKVIKPVVVSKQVIKPVKVEKAPLVKAEKPEKAPVAKPAKPATSKEKPVVKKSIVAPITFRQEDPGPAKFIKEPNGKFEMEFVIRASEDMVFEFVSTESGLSEWFCDDVTIRNGIFTFIWDGQEQQAKLVKELPPSYIRYQWMDKNDGSYFEFKTQKDELTNDISLIITDFASDKSDEESARLLWNSQVDKLLHVLGSFF